MKKILIGLALLVTSSLLSTLPLPLRAQRVLVVASRASDHVRMIAAARPFFQRLADSTGLMIDFTDDTSVINDANLHRYQAFVMLHLAPFDMSYAQQAALQRFIEAGGGWVGIHAAGLTGAGFLAPHTRYWQWFEDFMGGVAYSPHPAYQPARLVVEDRGHPVAAGLPSSFIVSDEWYEFSSSPRSRVHVLASVDESTYHQNKPMGDHPIAWCNEQYPHTVYIGVGHDPSVLDNAAYARLLRNALLWAARPSVPIEMAGGRVSYGQVLSTPQSPGVVYARAKTWFEGPSPDHNLHLDFADSNHLSGSDVLKVGAFFVRFRFDVTVRDGSYILHTDHYRVVCRSGSRHARIVGVLGPCARRPSPLPGAGPVREWRLA